METLYAHNQFVQPFGTEAYYNIGYDFNQESSQVQSRTRPYNLPERTPHVQHVQENPKVKTDSTIEQNTPVDTKVSSSSNDMSLSRGQPLRITKKPTALIHDNFVEECVGTSDAESGERDYFMRCIVMGAENTGKNTLIYSNFMDPTQNIEKPRNGVNFITKTKVNHKTTRKYHFWVRTLGDKSETKEAIWKTYYKSANAFVFVYDTTNKESFKALEEAVQKVLEVVPREKFCGILVGNKSDLFTKSAVDFNDANEFKKKYGLTYFVETCSAVESETPHLLPRLNTQNKLIYEEF